MRDVATELHDPALPRGAHASPGAVARLLGEGPIRRALRVPLFGKLLLANAILVALAGAAAVLVASAVGAAGPAAVGLFALIVLGLGAVVNAAVIRVALSPLAALERTARRVQQGDYSARAPSSPLADEELGRLISLFNHVLDGIEAYRERGKELAVRVLQAEERERELLAHELYSGAAQTLAGVLVRLRLAARTDGAGSGGGAAAVTATTTEDEVRDEVARALDEIRAIARRLRPPELDELGVRAALEAHARYLTEGRRMRVSFHGDIDETRLSRESGLALFRIAQEALSNAALHSGGSSVTVSFQPTERGLVTDIVDDGCGFDPDRRLFSGSGGLGLLSMRERAGYVSGSLAVESGPGDGTRVRVMIPWTPDGVAADGRFHL